MFKLFMNYVSKLLSLVSETEFNLISLIGIMKNKSALNCLTKYPPLSLVLNWFKMFILLYTGHGSGYGSNEVVPIRHKNKTLYVIAIVHKKRTK